ncbi:5'-nucleotidase C-terminal domain-containing protein [Sporosarcina sp. NPDC096371]|uniref:5'-nucleotidase C-terminal domain-containing protein n=1 Tax=Sporosarcina sp. NPDC096371 TaxID=3364530 RepID=UPI003807E4D2
MNSYKLWKVATASAVAIGAITVAVPSAGAYGEVFTDVPMKSSAYKEIISLAERGIINGFSDGTYRPSQAVTRGQAAKLLVELLDLDVENVKDPKFKDVPQSNIFYKHIAALSNKGIIGGYGDGRFGVNDSLTRGQMAKILAESFGFEQKAYQPNTFSDVQVDAYYAKHVQGLVNLKVTLGTTPTTFSPNQVVTRGQMAQFLYRSDAVKFGNYIVADVEAVKDGKVITTEGIYNVPTPLKPFFKAENDRALKGASLTFRIRNGYISSVEEIELKSSGTASSIVVLDGGNMSMDGDVRVQADYLLLKNLDMKGTAVIADDYRLQTNASTQFDNVHMNQLRVMKKGSNIVFKNKSSVQQMQVTQNTRIHTESTSKIKSIEVSDAVAELAVNGLVDSLEVNTTTPFTLLGTGTIGKVNVLSKSKATLNFIGKIGTLQLSKNATVDINENTIIDNLQLPSGIKAEQLIVNFKAIKYNIKEINGKKNPDYYKPQPPNEEEPTRPAPVPKKFTLSLMHSNDTHAHLDDIAKRVTAVKDVRAKKPSALLIDAGDVFSGTLYFNEFNGLADLEFMNLMNYDVMTFGNHEFDLGSSAEGHRALANFVRGAKFSFVSANIDFSKDGHFDGLFSDLISSKPKDGEIYSGMVKVIDGEKVGLFGLTTAETATISSPGKVKFENYIEEAKKAVKAFEGMGVNKIVAVTHVGYDDNPASDNDLELAARVEGIDVIVGGHSHTALTKPVVVTKDAKGKAKSPTVIVQAYQYNEFLGTLDVEFDKNGRVIGQAGKLIKIADQKSDPAATKLLKKYKKKIDEVKNKPTGATAKNALDNPRSNGDKTKPSVRRNETPLGNLITDGMLAKAKMHNKDVVMALQNGGGIRAGMDKGPITVGEVITVLPFGNTLAIMELSGAELKAAFEISFRDYPGENGGFLHVSGAQVTFDSSKSVGKRVVSIAYNNGDGKYTEIQDAKRYIIATNAFTAKGGDDYTVFKKAYEEGRVTDLGLSDWENLRDHVAKLGEVDPEIEGRIVNVVGQ